MTKGEFLTEIERIDRELAEEKLPVFARTLEAFHRLSLNYEGPLGGYGVDAEKYPEFTGPRLIEQIDEWYKERYGDRAYMPSVRGKVPIVLRKEVYLIRIPLVYGRPKMNILDFVEGLTKSMILSLDRGEQDSIRQTFREGYALIYEIEDLVSWLEGNAGSIGQLALQLLKNAVEDRDTAIRCLSGIPDTNGSCFHAQQHGEKMLKGFLLSSGIYTAEDLKRMGHNVRSVFEKCERVSSAFTSLMTSIGLLANIPMSIRYSAERIDAKIAAETVWAALRVGALTACQISGHPRREMPQMI